MHLRDVTRAVGTPSVLLVDRALGGAIWRVVEESYMTGLDVDLQLGVLAGCVYVETTVHCHERIVAANTACIGPLASLTEETRNAVLSISSQMQLALAARTVARARRVLLAMPDVRPEHRHHRHRHGRS